MTSNKINEPFAQYSDLAGSFIVNNSLMAAFIPGKGACLILTVVKTFDPI